MQYVVYCDESRHDGGAESRFMAIGSLWVPRCRKVEITKTLRSLFRDEGLHAEVKWSKVSASRLKPYQKVVDFFFAEEALRFRVIVVDHTKYDPERFHGGDRELGFYKFYYEMLVQWLEPGNEYLILLDFKQNQSVDRYRDLRAVLTRKLKGAAKILDLTVIDSGETPLAQLCDLLTGAVASAWCGESKAGSAKAELCAHIAKRRGLSTVKIASASPEISKFNVFKIDLQ
ncbi:MAG: DUF3800 domain-containing protein [Acidobacteria bacterium]|nr:DUF3800 domain-containing protein [Acidobacteriota bacterium]